MAEPLPVRTSHHGRWTPGATAWFIAMVGGWIAFFALMALSEPSLEELWRGVRDLPLLVEGGVWLALFPFVLALGVWDASWSEWLRVALVVSFALGWSLAFLPREK